MECVNFWHSNYIDAETCQLLAINYGLFLCRFKEYPQTLTLPNDDMLIEPVTDQKSGWHSQKEGIEMWPPCLFVDIATYWVDVAEWGLWKWLLTDGKEGTAYSYFDSQWLKQMMYHMTCRRPAHTIWPAESTPSRRLNSIALSVWVCPVKSSGKIVSVYCTCFAG